MKILGIGADVWISSAALIDDGAVVAAVAEERFNRRKMSNDFATQAIDYCLSQAGCDLRDLDMVAIGWNPGPHIRSMSGRYSAGLRWRGEYLYSVAGSLANKMGSPEIERIEQVLRIDGSDERIVFINHHSAHAASTFYLSPFENAAILTIDGRGEMHTSTFGTGSSDGIDQFDAISLPHSLGLLYSTITEFLGFSAHTDEWKVMALASYGDAHSSYREKIGALLNLTEDGKFEQDLRYFDYYLFDKQPHLYSDKLVELLGPARKRDDPLEQRHYDIARALQDIFEATATHMLGHLHRETGEKNLCLAGGASMNSVFNGKIASVTDFENVFVPSCPDDTGVSVGAALYYYHDIAGGTERPQHAHNYWGPAYDEAEIAETIKKFKLKARKVDDICQSTAEMLTQGKIIGWFQGAMEFGQRALGNRSILADARREDAKDLVNAAVKYRESFRPFAPAVLAERAPEYFDIPKGVDVSFMEKVFPVREERRAQIPAVVHVDGSGRLQTVKEADNPRFYQLIERFDELTSTPIILNTSFNLNGEPIVCNPTDAVRTFYSCGLDALVIGDWLIEK